MTDGRPDVVLIGATTLLGAELRRELAERHSPLQDVTMMAGGGTETVGQVVEYAGEPRLINEIDDDHIERADLLLLAMPGAAARRALIAAGQGRGVAVDLVDTEPGSASPVVNMAINAAALPTERPARVRSPHSVTQTLSGAVVAVAGDARIEALSATVLLPVSDQGAPGIDELYRQTAGALNFADMPTELFGRQVAFNAIPVALLHRQNAWPDLDRRLRDETTAVLGLSPDRVTVRTILVSVFHGAGLLVSLTLDPVPDRATRKKRWSAAPFEPTPRTPAELERSEAVHIVNLTETDHSPVEFWAAADLLRTGGIANAALIAEALVAPGGKR